MTLTEQKMQLQEKMHDADPQLKGDVNLLGNTLGNLIRRFAGDTVFNQVERARTTSRQRHAGDSHAGRSLQQQLSALEPHNGCEIARAFSAYFGLINIAECVHRVRRRRLYDKRGQDQPGSYNAVLHALCKAAISIEDVAAMIDKTQFTPVLTAHPTEAKRRTLLILEQRITRALLQYSNASIMTPAEQQALLDTIEEEIGIAWYTDEDFAQPSVFNEVEHESFFLSQVIYPILPSIYTHLQAAISTVYGADINLPIPSRLLRFATWVGGDMDGNPNVDATTILTTLAHHRQLIIQCYRKELNQLFERLSQSGALFSVDPALTEGIANAQQQLGIQTLPGEVVAKRYHNMPYRVFSALIERRLAATLTAGAGGYDNAGELEADLRTMRDSMRYQHGIGSNSVSALLRRVEVFGFHMATLDIRQDSAIHCEAVAEALGREDFSSLVPTQRLSLLRDALNSGQPLAQPPRRGGALERCLQTLQSIADARQRYGPEAIGPYIISMAHAVDDVLMVLWLARLADLAPADQPLPLDIAPLFETVEDLDGAANMLQCLLDEPLYRAHLRARGDSQVIMLGYSDSNKDAGLAASRWALYTAQTELARVMQQHPQGPILPTLFHGRGGTISRGGSKPRSGILAEPRGGLQGRLRVTEQGETIARKYGIGEIAVRTIEMATGAMFERAIIEHPQDADMTLWSQAAQAMASASRDAYRQLIEHTDGFIPYFRLATPIDVIERMRIGSRPPARRSHIGVANLRAIPWVFAWMQSRLNLPGWYAVGNGLQQLIDRFGVAGVREISARWIFLRNLVEDTEVVLATSDLWIAAQYSALAGEGGEAIYQRLVREFEHTRELICNIQDVDELLDRQPVIQHSIRLRNPYVDPISLIQIDCLARWRASDRQDKALFKVLMATVRGIANGIQSTG